jgi:hypothetical protein
VAGARERKDDLGAAVRVRNFWGGRADILLVVFLRGYKACVCKRRRVVQVACDCRLGDVAEVGETARSRKKGLVVVCG